MKYQLILWIILSIVALPLQSETPKTMKSYLQKAQPGDYVVAKMHKTITLLRIHSIDHQTVSLEEISAPLGNLKPYPVSWHEWIQDQAPGHTSWSILKIDFSSGEILSCYSVPKRSWIKINTQESLFATLLNLPLNKIKDHLLRKIGPPPSFDEQDTRPTWKPPFIFEGKQVAHPVFDVFETTWPDDGSELKNTPLTLYFDQTQQISMPIWIQFNTSHASIHIQVIDSGKRQKIH